VHLTAVNSMKGIKARVGENRMLVILRWRRARLEAAEADVVSNGNGTSASRWR